MHMIVGLPNPSSRENLPSFLSALPGVNSRDAIFDRVRALSAEVL